MTGISIRRALVSDIPMLVRHRRLMWWDMGRRDETQHALSDQASNEYFSTAVADGSYQGFLAVTSTGTVVGGGGIVISAWPSLLGQRQPKRAMILNVYVERDYRRRGIARDLMLAMIDWCRSNGFVNVGLHASDEGRPLYEKLGFKPTNEMRLDFATQSAKA
jgi:GNAT superfamily N-acetyltransferase